MTSTVGAPVPYDPSRRSDLTQKSSRLGEYGAGQTGSPKDSSSLNMPAIGPYGSGTWNGGGIWGSKASAIGSGLKSNDVSRSARSQHTNGESPSPGGVDLSVLEGSEEITGSGSLLPSSESDGWGRRNSMQWPSLGATPFTNGLASSRNGHDSTSPVRSRTSQHTRSNSPYHNNQISAIGTQTASKGQSLLDPTSRTFNSSGVFNSLQGAGMRPNGHDKGRNLDSVQLGNVGANGTHSYSGYASSAASRSGSLPPSRHGNEPSGAPQFGDLGSSSLYQPSKSEIFSHRRNEPSMSSNFSTSGQTKGPDSNWGPMNDISSSFSRIDMNRDAADNFQANWDNIYQVNSPTGLNGSYGGFQRNGSISYDQDARVPQSVQPYNRFASQLSFGDMSSQSPGGLDNRRSQESPLYSSNTPPLQEHHRAPSTASTRSGFSSNNYNNPSILDRKLRNLQEAQQFGNMTANQAMAYRQSQQHFYPYAGNMPPAALARMNMSQPYYGHVNPMNMNPYQMNGLPQTHRVPPRGPAVENQEAPSLRSALMEEFRSSKGNRKYELKDIYNHVVEFSGDQHGSRFIQQKLETANSDEKAQLFSEILPNSYQLMTDVFGNYVCQKFFEHGNQTQKKQLADKMKGLVTELSLQMYGCRVVQKAFEHILTDQQAALVKELEPEILRCIKDQNGNHVVQKAIQRIAPEHITFINRAVSTNVFHLAAHSYGCRVIQRMLEFCPPVTRNEVIDELHACALNLIVDQYGNYVIQNVMDHGRPEDRLKLIEITIDKVLVYSRHKYASNVVEHCLRKGTDEHRKRIVDMVRSVDDRGESRMNQLVRDQYGNYVIQTIIKILEGDERKSFMEQVKAIVEKVRHFSYGKHIGQIEKLIEEKCRELAQQQASVNTSASHTPPVTGGTSPQSMSQSSTANTSAVEDPVDSTVSKDK